MMSRMRLRRFAQVVLCAMLFAQAALASAACDWLNRAPAQSIGERTGGAQCHEEPARNANLCLAHCLGTDQSTDIPQSYVAPMAGPVLLVGSMSDGATARAAVMRHALPRPGAPPPRILYQSFLI